MRNKRAFWMTLLVYAFAGPLVGLLSVVVIGLVVQAWGPIIDRLEALIPHAQTSSCGPYSEHFDLRCFQLPPDPRRFQLSLALAGAVTVRSLCLYHRFYSSIAGRLPHLRG